MRSLLIAIALVLSTAAFAGDVNADLKDSQKGLKNFFDPFEKKIHDAGPQGQANQKAKKADPPKTAEAPKKATAPKAKAK